MAIFFIYGYINNNSNNNSCNSNSSSNKTIKKNNFSQINSEKYYKPNSTEYHKHNKKNKYWKNNEIILNDSLSKQRIENCPELQQKQQKFVPKLGINYITLNADNMQEIDFDNIRMSFSGSKKQNLRLDGIGMQKIPHKKLRLYGISTDAPLRLSPAFGRTAYTFIDNNNDKNKLNFIKIVKPNNVNKGNLDIIFAPNNY